MAVVSCNLPSSIVWTPREQNWTTLKKRISEPRSSWTRMFCYGKEFEPNPYIHHNPNRTELQLFSTWVFFPVSNCYCMMLYAHTVFAETKTLFWLACNILQCIMNIVFVFVIILSGFLQFSVRMFFIADYRLSGLLCVLPRIFLEKLRCWVLCVPGVSIRVHTAKLNVCNRPLSRWLSQPQFILVGHRP